MRRVLARSLYILSFLKTVLSQTCDVHFSTCNPLLSSQDAHANPSIPADEAGPDEHVSLLQRGLRGGDKQASQRKKTPMEYSQKKTETLIAELETLRSELKGNGKQGSENCEDSSGTSVFGTTCTESQQFCFDTGLNWENPSRTNAFACPVTCGLCKPETPACVDTDEHCPAWAQEGQCKKEGVDMKTTCPKSCGICERQEIESHDGMLYHTHEKWVPLEGPMPGMMPGVTRPKLIMGMDVDYPPYTYLRQEPFDHRTDLDEVVGVGADMIKGMAAHCGFDVSIMQVHWSDCWGNNEIGQGLLQGWYHGCMTYTHATGARNRYLDFTNSWAKPNKPAGLIVKLVDGKPVFDGYDDLNNRIIVDVTGWAPTADTLHFVVNKCTNKPYKGFKIIQGGDMSIDNESESKGPNDRALLAVLEGKADAMWIYGDQAENYQCSEGTDEDGWNCELWKGFGKTFAYVQSGMYGWMHNGTTIAMAKKGSGVSSYLDHCFEAFRRTKQFYEVCKREHHGHSQLNTCIPNKYFYEDADFKPWGIEHQPYMFPTNEHETGCSTGYCTCHG